MVKSKFTKLLCLVLSLVMILGAVPFTRITAFAADELTETISLVGGSNSVSGTHFNASASDCNSGLGLEVSDSSSLVISARKDETITKVVLGYSLVYKCTSSDKGTFDGDATFSDINAKEITIYNNSYTVCGVNSVTVYYLGDSSKPSVTVTGGANADVSGGWTTQQYLPGAMDTLVYTAMTGASFKAFEPYTIDGITVERISSTKVTVSGTPTGNTQITVPDAETKGKIVKYTSEEFKQIGSRLSMSGRYTDRNTGLTFSTTGVSRGVNIRGDTLDIRDGASLVFSTSEDKIANITISYNEIGEVNDSNWTNADGKVTWSGTPSESVTLSGMCTIMGFTGITIYIKPPHVHSFAADWSSDENGHWHACTEEDCDIEDYAASEVEGIAYGTHDVVNGVCTVCQKRFIEFTAENNVLTAALDDSRYTLTLADNGTISAEEISIWEAAGLTVPEIVFNAAANTASITAGGATATVSLAQGALRTHTVKVICGADENGNSYIADALTGTDITVTAGTYEGKLFEKWISDLSVDGSTDETVTFRMPDRDVTLEAEFVDCYALSVFDGTTLTSEPQKVNYSAAVTVPATPEGMRFTGWTAVGLTLADPMASAITFDMPANAVMLTANFAAVHTVSVTGGTIAGSDKAIAGETVSITADADNNDSRFTEWSSEADITFADKTAETTTFIMPDADVSVTANREQSYTVTVTDGTVTAGLNGAGKAFAGFTVTVAANNVSGHNFTGWTGDGVEFADAASAATTFTMPGGNVSVKANYEQIKVAYPTAGTKTYTYSGDYQSYEFANEGDKSYYSLSGNVQKNAGTYTVKAHLTTDGTAWTDGTTADKEFTFVIARQPIEKPIAYNTQYYYNGAEQSFILCRQINGSYYYYESTVPADSFYIRGNTRADAGSQAVTVTPADNYCWQDGTTGTLYFNFTINRYPIPTLFDDPRSFTFNGNAQTYTPFVMRNGKLYDFDGLYYDLSNRTQTASGSYTVTATLRNNFCWYDGSTAARNFTFTIKPNELDSFVYYVDDMKTGENVVCVDMTYTSYDITNTLKGFERHPSFKPEMLKDRYQPCLMDAPAGSDVTFYLKETPGTPKNISEVNKCKRWNDVKMEDLKPNTIYYMFAVVTHPDYANYQITEVNNMSRFITSNPQFTLINCKRVKETEVNQSYKFDCAMAIYTGNINDMLGAFGNKSTSKYVNVTTKAANYTNIEDALAQAIKDIEEGLDGALIGWYDAHGVMQSFSFFPSNVAQARTVLAKLTAKSAAPKRMYAAAAEDPAPVEIAGISGEAPELTPELLNSMFTTEQLAVLPLLDNAEFKMEMELETTSAQIEDKNEELIARLAAEGIAPDAEEPDGFYGTVTINTLLYDMKTEAVDGGSVEYTLGVGEKLPADAIADIEGYTFEGLFYREIMGFEKDSKPEEATGDHGMILTQGLVKWDPETDFVTRDTDLMAIYVKNGAEEPVGYLTSGTAFTGAGSEAVVTLPALLDGMTYGSVVNNNENITVSAVSDGKVTVTAVNELSGTEPITFTVGVNANTEGIEDPFYYILVTINTVDEDDAKEEAQAFIEALADDAASDEVLAIISDAVAALEDADSYDAVSAIKAKAVEDVAAQILNEAKTEAIDAVNEAAGTNPSSELAIVLAYAAMAINNADSINAVEAEMQNALAVIAKLSDDYTYSTEWSTNATHHWHEANGNHPGYVSDYAEHTFGDDNKCTACGYEKQAGEKKYTVVLTGLSNPDKNYSGATDDNGICNIENIENGTYLMAISCEGAVTRTYTTEITDGTISQDIELYDDGDVNGDGEITVEDYSAAVNAALSGENEVPEDLSLDTDYSKAVADCDGDGVVDVLDVAMLERKIFA